MDKKIERPVHKKSGIKIFIIVAISLVVIIAGLVVFGYAYGSKYILSNTYINEIDVSGLTVDEAEELVADRADDFLAGKFVDIRYGDKVCQLELDRFVTIDSYESASNAMGSSHNIFKRLFRQDKVTVPFEYEINEDIPREKIILFVRDAEDTDIMFEFDKEYQNVKVNIDSIDKLGYTEKALELLCDNIEAEIYSPIDIEFIYKNNGEYAEELYKRLNRPARDAIIKSNDDGTTYIVPEEYGIIADEDMFEDLYEENNGSFSMPVRSVKPKIFVKDLDIEFYQDILGEYTSAYNMGLVNRSKNVSLAASLVNGAVIMPGKRFSYNSVVGKRTYERGFLDATVYTGEGTEEGIGGGICQVSSTIYCAQLRADLKTISRTNHSYTVVYVPLGQDATVVYGSIDYIFENNTNYPVKILASASGGYLTVKIMGTRIDKSEKTEIVSYTNSTTPKSETIKETPDLPKGVTEVKQNGQNGAVVSTYRIYYKDGKEIKKDFISTSKYIPMNKIVLVGIGEEISGQEGSDSDKSNEAGENIPDENNSGNEGELPAVEVPDEEISESVTVDNTENILPNNLQEFPTSDTGL